MNVVWKTALAAGIALAAVTGGAQAADIGYYRGVDGDGYATSRADRDDDRFDDREDLGIRVVERRERLEERFERHHPGDRYDNRPIRRPDWDRPSWHRPVYGGPRWSRYDDCRVVITRRVNRWGEMVVSRKHVCR